MPTSQPSILVVEDEELLSEAIKLKLEKSGYKVLLARTVDQALDYLNEIPEIDVVWLDHYLPDKTGDELVTAMKKDEKLKLLPIYLVTNSINPEIVNKYLRLGISQYYPKALTKLEKIVSMISAELQGFSSK
ncbi:MAG: response regulator [Candidatus Kerfeldbacteria bacterium]|nr:response regulator [Candidatus Kerfeldbacteria bacterium]